MAPIARVAELLLQRDIFGPSFGNAATSVVALLFAEKVAIDFVLPLFLPNVEAMALAHGRTWFVAIVSLWVGILGYWCAASVFTLPAIVGSKIFKIRQDKSLDIRMLLNSMPLIIFNWCVSLIVMIVCLAKGLPESSHDWHALPTSAILVRDVVVWIAFEELMFFYVHRFLHTNKWAYANIHKIHHRWKAPVAYVAIYAHPLEHLASNLAPLMGGILLCRSHVFTAWVYIFLGQVHTTLVHSGYWFCDDNGMHDEHHASFDCSYGVTGMLDSYYGSYKLPQGAKKD